MFEESDLNDGVVVDTLQEHEAGTLTQATGLIVKDSHGEIYRWLTNTQTEKDDLHGGDDKLKHQQSETQKLTPNNLRSNSLMAFSLLVVPGGLLHIRLYLTRICEIVHLLKFGYCPYLFLSCIHPSIYKWVCM